MSLSCLASNVVCGPACQACGIRLGSVKPGTASKAMPGASTMRSACSCVSSARRTRAATGSMNVTSPVTTVTP